mmetsp:Transcript_5959/g.12067  ORF Transcript_5959/g.12067 Transcript_5959/m.12067 type:complete len:87 (-) Transcript_5959:86-346(-)
MWMLKGSSMTCPTSSITKRHQHMMITGSGQEDELRIEASLGVLRGDVFERIPASDPQLMEGQGNFLTDAQYEVYQFHEDWKKTAGA